MDDSEARDAKGPDTGEAGIHLPALTALVVDIAAAAETEETQEAVTDFIAHMLERDYQIYLCSSTTNDDDDNLPEEGEAYEHPQLTWFTGDLPPGKADLAEHPGLASAETLWISDNEDVLQWAKERGSPFLSLGRKTASFQEDLHLSGWGELGALLDPTMQAAWQVADAIAALRRSRPSGPLLVGLGGPPASGYERFALELKRVLEASDTPLVEIINAGPFLEDESGGVGETAAAATARAPALDWLLESVLRPISTGGTVYVEHAPKLVPEDFREMLPLYVSTETVVLVHGERVFHRALRDLMHLAILVEVSASETARRMFEIPEDQPFDASFTKQYLERDGKLYENYRSANQVVERSDIRLDANSPRRFRVIPAPQAKN